MPPFRPGPQIEPDPDLVGHADHERCGGRSDSELRQLHREFAFRVQVAVGPPFEGPRRLDGHLATAHLERAADRERTSPPRGPFGAEAVVTTSRHAAAETGTLAKAASGALDQIKWIEVQNLARALEEIGKLGFTRIGLDSDAEREIETAIAGERIALVLGAEGKGLRRLTQETCDAVARLVVPGAITSLNVSNAAVLALYLASRHLNPAA